MNKKQIVVTLFVFAALGFSAQAKMINFAKTDTNNDGEVSKEEFIAEHTAVNPNTPKKRVEQWFETKDADKSGTLTKEEFKSTPNK